MEICEYLKSEYIFLNSLLSNKESVLRFIADTCVVHGVAKDSALIYEGLHTREQTMSTGVGGGIAFPHTTSMEVKDPAVFLIRLAEPIDFDALDNLPVDIVLALVIPEDKTTLHLRLLARISRLYKNTDFVQMVNTSGDSMKLWGDIKDLEGKLSFA